MEKMIVAEMSIASSTDTGSLDFETLVYAHGRFVLNVAYAVLRNSEDAEDVAQETFFKAFRSGNIAHVEHMRAWLGRIAWRLALNRRSRHCGSRHTIESDRVLRTMPSQTAGAEELLIRKERGILLERLLSSLPSDLRETFVLLAIEEMTSHDAGEILGISESSIRNRLFRARKLMKEKLAILMEGGNEPRGA
jgi:RNA polymerase sigma-70 factor (ECF subfamily)